MTGNMIKGKGFGGALRYNLEKIEQEMAEVLDHNFLEVSERSIMQEVQIIRNLRPNLQKFFYHTSINFPPNENLTNDLMKQIGRDYLQQSGFTSHQYIIFRHYDADHPHIHILVNRIGYDGKVMSDSNDFAKCEAILRTLEKKYNLTEVPSSKQAQKRAVTKDELEMMKRTKSLSGKVKLQALVKEVLGSGQKMSTSEFIKALESKGVHVKFNQATTGYVSGISYSYEEFLTTGAKLGNNYKWSAIKSKIDYDQVRDLKIIEGTNQKLQSDIPKVTHQQKQSLMQSQTLKDFTNHPNDFGLGSLLESGPDGTDYNMEARIDQEGNPYTKKKKKKRKGIRPS